MIYYKDEHVIIRDMRVEDSETIHSENISLGWHSDIKIYEQYFCEQENKTRRVFVAVYDGSFAGYTTLRPQAGAGPFANKCIPEVVDFNVFVKYRCKGIGGKLLDAAEKVAAETSDTITLGVGLHSGYGSAQRLYVKRGYIPDGSGVWYKDCQLAQYADCCNDDDLVLYFSKRL